MALTNSQENMHLLWRAGFGPSVSGLHFLKTSSPKKLLSALLRTSQKMPDDFQMVDEALIAFANDRQALRKLMNKDEKRMIGQKNVNSIRKINLAWMSEMVNSEAQLREKAAFFWHGHFACRSINAIHQQALLNIVRKNALGNFRDLLHEVSKSAAMLNFLNNNQNRKDHPNENFAREVMELFTLGRGNYTESDIREAARAFTGWGANPAGNFVFRKQQHDTGIKTVLGKTGNFDGDDVLDILLQQKQTARFIVNKLYRFYVNGQPHQKQIEELADFFYTNNYDITSLLNRIFTSSGFYHPSNFGVKIKSPVELLVGIQRILPMTIDDPNSLLILQRILGQVLLYPPNVAGWPGDKNWIDSSTLMMRMHLPDLISQADTLQVKPKDDDDQMMGRPDNEGISKAGRRSLKKTGKLKQFAATVDWNQYLRQFMNTAEDKLIHSIATVLVQSQTAIPEKLIMPSTENANRENHIKSATIQLMSTPEYQLC